MQELLTIIKTKKPIIFSITNYVSVNDCANSILALGGSPIMSSEYCEVEQLVKLSDVIYVNIGTATKMDQKVIVSAIKYAKKYIKPIVFDPVGSGATTYRTKLSKKLINLMYDLPGVIKGNVSEIKSLLSNEMTTKGVDANENDSLNKNQLIQLSKSTNKVIIATGKVDSIAYKDEYCVVTGGSILLKQVTGTGCMLGSIISCFVAVENKNIFKSVKNASNYFKSAGEKSVSSFGPGTFRHHLIDNLSKQINKNEK